MDSSDLFTRNSWEAQILNTRNSLLFVDIRGKIVWSNSIFLDYVKSHESDWIGHNLFEKGVILSKGDEELEFSEITENDLWEGAIHIESSSMWSTPQPCSVIKLKKYNKSDLFAIVCERPRNSILSHKRILAHKTENSEKEREHCESLPNICSVSNWIRCIEASVLQFAWSRAVTFLLTYQKTSDGVDIGEVKILANILSAIFKLSSDCTEYGFINLSVSIKNEELNLKLEDTGEDIGEIKSRLDANSTAKEWKIVEQLIDLNHNLKSKKIHFSHNHSSAGNVYRLKWPLLHKESNTVPKQQVSKILISPEFDVEFETRFKELANEAIVALVSEIETEGKHCPKKLAEILHKLKPSLKMVGLYQLAEKVVFIELLIKENAEANYLQKELGTLLGALKSYKLKNGVFYV